MIKPILNQILFKPLPADDKTDGGLYIPDSCKKPSNRGVVIGVGRGTAKKPMMLKEGMVVHRVKDWGQEIMENEELYFLMDEGAILAIE